MRIPFLRRRQLRLQLSYYHFFLSFSARLNFNSRCTLAAALSLKVHTGLMNIDKQYKKPPNQYLHENMGWTLCSAAAAVVPAAAAAEELRGLRDIGLAAQTCDRVVTWFSNPKREAGTYLRAARVPMATTEVWCHRLAEHVFTSDCVETLAL